AWQVQTQLGHMQQLLAEGAGQGEIAAQLGAGAGGHAYHGNQAYALEGNAAESADFKTQSFGVLVVHLNTEAVKASTQALQSLQDQQAEHAVQTRTLYRDTEGDGYFEKTQWVSATDAQGKPQGMLVLDYNGNGQIETRDILNLGGNAGHATEGAAQPGNHAADALAATANAHLQRNNVEWLDANGDGVLDKSDPAFAAIRLWVDMNLNARLDKGEQVDLASLQITSINLREGTVTYADGHKDALSSTTLKSDTEGMRYTQMQEADAQGNLHTINAGQMLEHEGYQGQVKVTDQAGVTQWGSVREATFEHDALRTGDWEGTAECEQHRHGGTNVASAPTQTTATGAVGLGEVKRANNGGSNGMLTPKRLVFVPSTAGLGSDRTDSPTAQMVRSAEQGALLGAGMGALALVGLGAVQTTAFAAPAQERMYASDDERVRTSDKGVPASDARHTALPSDPGLPPPGETVLGNGLGEPRQAAPWLVVDAPPPPGIPADTDALQRIGLDLSAYTEAQMPLREMRATLVSNGIPSAAPATNAAVDNPAGNREVLLDLPKVSGEVLAGTEDTVLRIGTDVLLGNDSTNNANAALHISAVGNASHGQVSLQTSVNGAGQTVTEVVFLPDPDFYGTASFSYTVTDAYGLSSTATATLLVENVNDAPYAQGEVVSGASEDATFLIHKAVLLANDGDVDDPASALGIGWVGNALNGVVSLDADGNVVFVPEPDFNGNAEFEYRTVDAAGLLSPAVQVVMPVVAVNDAPLAVDDQFQTYVNSTMTIGFAQLLGNDSDTENDTLSLVNVGNASHGVVAIVNGQVQFVPTAGFTGAASFDYLADDGNGGQAWATAFVEVKPPPNLYASVNLLATSFYGTEGNAGSRIDIASASWQVMDDGDTAFATVQLLDMSVFRGSGGLGSSPSWQSLGGVNYFSYSKTGMGLDVQRWAGFSDFQSTWQVTDDRGLSNIWYFNYSVSGGATSYMEHSDYVTPVVLSLDGSVPSYISTRYSKVSYDIDLDGVSDKIAWAAPGSGVLGLDLNGDHQISSASEFAFKQYVEGAQTDLEGLRAFDTNHNGQLDAGDAQWMKFGVWEDKNADGKTQDGEYRSLDALGIATINLQSNAQMHSGASSSGGASTDVTVMGDSTFTRTDGSTGVAEDAMLAYQSGVYARAAEADMARMALLFNQMANTAVALDTGPLGFVPLNPHELVVAHEELLALQTA
ncbi:MAG: tandem-95 repeat protein, partial [Betaproteobacteria bacterium]|nr:tandem-95 repeat protein [Betaproteobacteria bacterium]